MRKFYVGYHPCSMNEGYFSGAKKKFLKTTGKNKSTMALYLDITLTELIINKGMNLGRHKYISSYNNIILI